MRTGQEVISDIIKRREMKGYSAAELARRVGISRAAQSRYEKGDRSFPINDIDKYAMALDTTVPNLLGIDGEEAQLAPVVNLPVVGKISCGKGVVAFEDIEGYELTPKSWLHGGEYFYLRAKGDSMEGARIHDGDLLFIRKQEDIEDGEIAAVYMNGEAVLKRVFKRNGSLILQSENPKYSPIVLKSGDVHIIGKLKKLVVTY